MITKSIKQYTVVALAVATTSCSTMKETVLPKGVQLPNHFTLSADTSNNPLVLKDFFADAKLQKLIDTALANNLDLQAALQRIQIARANTRMANAALRPSVSAVAGAAVDKYGKYTLNGVGNFISAN